MICGCVPGRTCDHHLWSKKTEKPKNHQTWKHLHITMKLTSSETSPSRPQESRESPHAQMVQVLPNQLFSHLLIRMLQCKFLELREVVARTFGLESRVSTNLHESRSRMRFLGNLTGTKTLKDRLLNPMDLKRYNAN